eukprot:492257_1
MPSQKRVVKYRRGRRNYYINGGMKPKSALKYKLSHINNDQRSKQTNNDDMKANILNNAFFTYIYNAKKLKISEPHRSKRKLQTKSMVQINVYLRNKTKKLWRNKHADYQAQFWYGNLIYVYSTLITICTRRRNMYNYRVPVNQGNSYKLSIDGKIKHINLHNLRKKIEMHIMKNHINCRKQIKNMKKKFKSSTIEINAVFILNKDEKKSNKVVNIKQQFHYAFNTYVTVNSFAVQDVYKLLKARVELKDATNRIQFDSVEYIENTDYANLRELPLLKRFGSTCLKKLKKHLFFDNRYDNKVLFQLSQIMLNERMGKLKFRLYPYWKLNDVHIYGNEIRPVVEDIFDVVYSFLPSKDVIYGVLMKYLGYEKLQYFIVNGKICMNKWQTSNMNNTANWKILQQKPVVLNQFDFKKLPYKYINRLGAFHCINIHKMRRRGYNNSYM